MGPILDPYGTHIGPISAAHMEPVYKNHVHPIWVPYCNPYGANVDPICFAGWVMTLKLIHVAP